MSSRQVEPRHWYVLTTFDPKDAEVQLRRENLRREDCGKAAFQFVVPSQLLKQQISHELPGDEPSVNDDSPLAYRDGDGAVVIDNPNSRTTVRRNNELRSALRRYIFIYGGVSELNKFLSDDWNKHHYNQIQFFCDRSRSEKSHPYVSRKVMAEFVRVLADRRLSFELSPSIDVLRKGEPVRFRSHYFEGRTVYVVESRRTKKGNVLTVELDLVKNALKMRVYDVRDEDIIHLDDAYNKYAKNNELIKRNQLQLLAIMGRRFNRKETEDTRMDDSLTLNTMYATRFRHFEASERAAYRHFLAQMLLCACLRHDADGRAEYTEQLLTELSEINRLSESKAATDVRARIHAVLFLATADPAYRAMARDYVHTHAPKSDKLRTLVKLISKREALKSV